MINRDEYVQKLKAQIDAWNAEAGRWEERMRKAQAGMKAEYERQMQNFRSKSDQAMAELRRLQAASADAWTEMMRGAKGRLISKVGAEGVYTVGVLPCAEWPNGFGLALKIEDGDDHRARPTVVIEALRQLGVLKDDSLEAVSRYAFFPVKNRRGDVVGEVTASFELNMVGSE